MGSETTRDCRFGDGFATFTIKDIGVVMDYPARCARDLRNSGSSTASAGSSADELPLGEVSRDANLCGVDVKVAATLVGVP